MLMVFWRGSRPTPTVMAASIGARRSFSRLEPRDGFCLLSSWASTKAGQPAQRLYYGPDGSFDRAETIRR
jgi:hypothetical protein